MPRGIYDRKKTVKEISKGISNLAGQFNPGAGLQTSATTTPESAISVAAMQSRFSSLQPVQAFQMSIAVRSAISAITNQISRCPIRLFDRKSGDEIIQGDLFDIIKRPSPGWSQHQFVEECLSWYNIENEISIMIVLDNSSKPVGLLPICPTRLWVLEPSVVNELKEINKWMYLWPSGMSPFSGMGTAQPENLKNLTVQTKINGYNSMVIDSRQLIFYKGFNPSSHIRGCSPLITGINELSTNYYAARYNKELFVNGAWPNMVLNVEGSLSEKQRKDLEQRFDETFSLFNGQSHKTLCISGPKVNVNTVGNGQTKEGDFLGMQRFYMENIFMLYRVPSIEAGFADKTRYETADQERAIFLEQTLLPQMNMFSEVLQHQLVNPYYTFSKRNTLERGQGKKIGKLMEKALDYSFNQRIESDIVVLLDPDELPIMSELRKTQWKAMQMMCDSLHFSVNEAAENLGVDIPYSKVRDQIYIPNAYQKIADSPQDDPKEEAKVALISREEIEALQNNSPKEDIETETEEDKENKKLIQKKLHTYFKDLRSKFLSSIEKGGTIILPSLKELDLFADSIFGDNKIIKQELRKDCCNIRKILKDNLEVTDRITKSKEYLNTKNIKYEKNLIGKICK